MFTFRNETDKDIPVIYDSKLYIVKAGEVFQTNNKELADAMTGVEGLHLGLSDGNDRGAVPEGQDPANEVGSSGEQTVPETSETAE